MMQVIKKLWPFLLAAIAFIVNQLPNWLPDDTRYQALNQALDVLRTVASYKVSVSITASIFLFVLGVGYFIFNRRQEERPIEKKFSIRKTICRVHAKNKDAFHNPNLITTLVKCANDGAKFEYHSGRDHDGYSCAVCGQQLSEQDYKVCRNEAEALFVQEHDPLNKSLR